ncbi:response regulator [bacterium]|nr:response regulator [bacterium]
MNGESTLRILVVEDNETDALLIREAFADCPGPAPEVVYVPRLGDGLERINDDHFDAALLDLALPDSSGLDTFVTFHQQAPRLPVLVLTGLEDESIGAEAITRGAQDYLVKGQLPASLLMRSIRYAIERQHFYRELDDRVRERTAQLALANRELDSFCHAVSHDLRAPLRSINGFGELLDKNHRNTLDDDGQRFLDRILEATGRMSELIDDLLSLSRVSRQELNFTPVDLSRLAQQVVETLRQNDPNRAVEVVIEEGLMVQGDGRLLRIVLENLLGNAWKFTSKTEGARIEVGREPAEEGEPVFHVRDNGAGFDMRYADKMFTAFQRLHHEEDFPGTGVGLATVQRIIHRHGGKVWAEGEPGEGARIYFIVP